MSITYYAYTQRELPKAGIEDGEIAVYLGTTRPGLRDGPTSTDTSQKAYVYYWRDGQGDDIEADLTRDSLGANVLDFTAGTDRYIFVCDEAGGYLRQVSGPAKPMVVGNIGADPIRVDTKLGKFMVPAGTLLRLCAGGQPQREVKKVLLTFNDQGGDRPPLESALLLDGGHWRPLNICVGTPLSGFASGSIQIKDGAFAVQTLTFKKLLSDVELEDPPVEPDYEIYFRNLAVLSHVSFTGLSMEAEGLSWKRRTFYPKRGAIYDLQALRQAPAAALMEQCTVDLPGLEGVIADLPEPDAAWPDPIEDERSGGIPLYDLLSQLSHE